MPIGFFGKNNVCLPHPRISLTIFLIVEEALCVAWSEIRKNPRPGFNLNKANEDEITHELYEILCDAVFNKKQVDGFDHQIFTKIAREPKVRNYNRGTLDKMPDLAVGLVGRANVYMPSQDWLFIECKPVGESHAVGTEYCDKGMIRFVRGDYAWTMQAAMMLGYVRAGFTIVPKVADALETRKTTLPTTSPPTKCKRSKASIYAEPTHISKHTRTFKYTETQTAAPPITLRHLWLMRD